MTSGKRMDQSVAVIIPTYNSKHSLARALASCLRQTHPASEIMVVDDGSTDGTERCMKGATADNPLIRYIRLASNQGPQAARFAGVGVSSSRWIAFLDADDELLDDSIERRIAAAEESGLDPGLVYGDLYINRVGPKACRFKHLAGYAYEQWLSRELSLSACSALMVRRDCFSVTGFPSMELPSGEDQDLTLTIGKFFPVLHCGAFVAIRHLSPGQLTRQPDRMIQGTRLLIEKYRSDIKKYHGAACLMFWNLRLASLRFAGLVEHFRERQAGLLRETGHRMGWRRVAYALWGRWITMVYVSLRRLLMLYFRNMPESFKRTKICPQP